MHLPQKAPWFRQGIGTLLAAVFCLGLSAFPAGSQEVPKEEYAQYLRGSIRHHRSLLRTLSVEFTVRMFRSDDQGNLELMRITHGTYQQAGEREAQHLRILDPEEESDGREEFAVTDGVVSITYSPQGLRGRGSASRSRGRSSAFESTTGPMRFRGFGYGGMDLLSPDSLREPLEVVQPPHGKGPTGCVVVKVHSEEGVEGRMWPYNSFVWLDEQKGYAPVRVECYDARSGRLSSVTHSVKLKEFDDGVWFPVAGVHERGARWTGDGDIASNNRYVYRAAEVAVNEPLSDDAFSLDVPAGTGFVDEIAGVQFDVGAADDPEMDARLADLHAEATRLLETPVTEVRDQETESASEAPQSDAGPSSRRPARPGDEEADELNGSGGKWRLWAGMAGLGILLIVATVIVSRKRWTEP